MKPQPPALSIAAIRRSGPSPRMLLSLALSVIVPAGIIIAVTRSRAGGPGALPLPPLHPHAPDLALIAAAPFQIKLHLLAVFLALGIGIALLIGVKGNRLHRAMGWTWVIAMMVGAVSSLFIRVVNHGALSYIHLLSGWVIVALPMGVACARRHRVRQHARMMTGLFTGGLILAGAFTFAPGRLMWSLFFR